jgi:hypothetical protein
VLALRVALRVARAGGCWGAIIVVVVVVVQREVEEGVGVAIGL